MHSLKLSFVLSLSALGLLVGVAAPAAALAANSNDGTLKVYVEVDDRYNQHDDYSPSDFTVRVYGDDVSKSSFHGSSNGTTVYADGWYSVSVPNTYGYTPSYSSGCSGNLDRYDNRTCRITLSGSRDNAYYGNYSGYNYYNANSAWQQYSYYTQPSCGGCQQTYQAYTQPCGCQAAAQPVVVSTYIPALPNTGFEPVNKIALAFSLALLSVLALLALPYVRKTLVAYVR